MVVELREEPVRIWGRASKRHFAGGHTLQHGADGYKVDLALATAQTALVVCAQATMTAHPGQDQLGAGAVRCAGPIPAGKLPLILPNR